ncbi:glycosyltransferase family 1 protein [Chryseobacterium sp. G0186]|uniref:glycosyltransferase n=1 Tax=Chryseobacterium sp. G0186 TaxID=2487064 RepID=UPI000F4FEF59|nr:glycosyltransferase [Chryseobacterium sp. G0186]AZA78634.1 glycosyltransferase family 1 protein [Chryseobacterium sp. G0186]
MKALHLISFNYPYPPSYGGIIDVYYKIKALSELGVKIHLHCFVNQIPEKTDPEIKNITENVFFYKKKKNPLLYFSPVPFAAAIRNSNMLLHNLMKIKAPVLFEGLQTTSLLTQLKDKGQYPLYLRLHNNEAEYYKGLSSSEKNIFKKIIYKVEAIKYENYQKKHLKEFKSVFCLSEKEFHETENYSGNAKLIHIFHGNRTVKLLDKKGDYFLFHGDLSISDNKKALEEVIELFKGFSQYKLIVASDRASDDIKKKINSVKNIKLVPIETNENLHHLLENAQANILLSFQNSGTKVKLFNSLYNSRFVIINQNITDDDSLRDLCLYGSNLQEIRQHIIDVAERDYSGSEHRKTVLEKEHSDESKAEEIIRVIFKN